MPASPELTEKITNAYVNSITTRLRWIVVLSIVSLVFSVIIVLHSQFKKPTPTYFAVNKKGQIMQLAPLKHPVYSAAYVSQYVTDALLKTFNYNYFDWQRVFHQAMIDFYTSQAMSSFIHSMQVNGSLDMMKQNKLLIKGIVTQTPIILKVYLLGGRYQWQVQTKMTLTGTNGATISSNQYDVMLTLQRVNLLDSYRGIRINQIFLDKEAS